MGPVVFLCLLISMFLSLYVGNQISVWQKKKYPDIKQPNNRIIEGAIFALMGLLIALTLAGAHERYDIRRSLIIEEANSIKTVYLRLDLLSNSANLAARNNLLSYLDARLSIYNKMPYLKAAEPELVRSNILTQQIWNAGIYACKTENNNAACIVLLPAINHMIDLANSRFETAQIHPPLVILITLITLALLSAAISGYSTQHRLMWRSLHLLIYAFIISFTIFIIIDLEYPHLGFFHVNYFNEVLVDLKHEIH